MQGREFEPQYQKKKNSLIKEPTSVNLVIIYYGSDDLNEVNIDMQQYLVTWTVRVTISQLYEYMIGRNFILDFMVLSFFSKHHQIARFKKIFQTANPSKHPDDTS